MIEFGVMPMEYAGPPCLTLTTAAPYWGEVLEIIGVKDETMK
jgi:hypothetical protein